ncbi:hypothetical protein L1987_72538 [Smallanthus sonchifolius]|uniref:Uncharacterized protein n=1 Tax=Smallanthus sonchifolius TaxID=185202 RepID=A0ACB9AZW5_9ASTR|nr:hypothetical protein L1987_72538 [Smallanthus sonchifolius]
MKLPVDLSGEIAAKVGSLGFMCTMMANLMPSLASMDNKTLLSNLIGLCILVITIVVNIIIEINTNAIFGKAGIKEYYVSFPVVALIYTSMMLLLLIIMISLSLTIPTSKEILDSKYQATNKTSFTDQSLKHNQMSQVEKLRQHVRRYWVMAETSSPQFVMASNPLSTASGIICLLSLIINLYLVLSRSLNAYSGWPSYQWTYVSFSQREYMKRSPYKGSTGVIFITQFIGVVVGTIAPISRCFSAFRLNLGNKWNWNLFFEVEKYWIQKLQEWKQSPVLFLSSSPRSRSLIYNSKNIILSLCIGFQKMIVVSCKVIWLIVTVVPIFVVSCFNPPGTSKTNDIDEDLSNYVLQIEKETKLAEKTLKGISKSMNSFISKAEKKQNNNLLELLNKSTGFEGVQIFDTDNVLSLLPNELVNGWSLPIVTLTCIAVALPNIRKDEVERLLRSVGEGLSFTHLVEESLNSANEYVNIRKTSLILWHEVENKWKWLDNPLTKNVFKGKKATEIIIWFSDKANEIVIEILKSTSGEPMSNPPTRLIAANSMYRITQTILLRYQNNREPITKKQLFADLCDIIADIFTACFTNIPRVITIRCHESVIEKREASVKVAAKLLGKTTKIIERLETCDKVPSMDDDKLAYIDEWRLYMKQSIP